MNSNATPTHPNSTESLLLVPTENGLNTLAEDNVTDEVVTDIESVDTNNELTQYEINDVAKNAMFDGNGCSKGNPNGESKEYEVVISDKTYDGIKDKIDDTLPIDKFSKSYDFDLLQQKEKELRNNLLDDLGKAQFYTMVSLYYYVKVGMTLLSIKNQRKSKSFKKIILSVDLNERTAFRYMALAKDDRFSNMTENQFKSLHHLTQSKMLMMTEFSNEEFEKALNDEDYEFPKKKKKIENKPSEYSMTDDKYKEFVGYDKQYLIKEYDKIYTLLLDYLSKDDIESKITNNTKDNDND